MADTTENVREERRAPRPGAEEVAPGVLRLQLPISMPGLGHVNCYAMEDSRGVTLVDPGLPGPRTWRALTSALASADLSVERVHSVVVTHSHPDHFGQAARLRSRVGAEVITHRSFRTFLDPTDEDDDADPITVLEQANGEVSVPDDQPARIGPAQDGPFAKSTPWGGRPFQLPLQRRLRYWAMRQAAGRFMAVPRPTTRVDDAQVLDLGGREWISVHTPGHTQDHLCLWDPANGIMLSGDHVLPTITPHISGMGVTPDPLADFFTSLDRMASFDGVTTVLPAHGLVFTDLASRSKAIKTHHHERLDVLRDAGGDLGQGTVEEYMRRLFKERSWGTMAESETYAHLEHLRRSGQAKVSAANAQLRYEITG